VDGHDVGGKGHDDVQDGNLEGVEVPIRELYTRFVEVEWLSLIITVELSQLRTAPCPEEFRDS
jgi:hypothetical protein